MPKPPVAEAFVIIALLSSAGLVKAEETSSIIAQADTAYSKREDVPQAKIAMLTYQRAAVMNSTRSVECYWKASRSAWWLGENSADREAKLHYFTTGMDFARQAVAISSDSIEGHFWLGANSGSYGKAKGVLKSLALVKPIRHEMEEVIRLDDHFLNGAAYRVLGVVDYKVPAIVGGSKARAKEELDKALSMGAQEPFIHYDLVDYYKTIGDDAEAKSELAVLHSLQVSPDLAPELKLLQAEADKIMTP
jgi:hypothetical protein